jgi:hypothetical protein
LVDRVRHYDALEYAWLLMNEEVGEGGDSLLLLGSVTGLLL